MIKIKVTKKEQKAIADLQKLMNKWPQTIEPFSWSGTLHVVKRIDDKMADLAIITGVCCDGGDPNYDEDIYWPSDIELEYE